MPDRVDGSVPQQKHYSRIRSTAEGTVSELNALLKVVQGWLHSGLQSSNLARLRELSVVQCIAAAGRESGVVVRAGAKVVGGE